MVTVKVRNTQMAILEEDCPVVCVEKHSLRCSQPEDVKGDKSRLI